MPRRIWPMEPSSPLAADNLKTAYSNFETRSDAVSPAQLSAFYEPRKDPKHLKSLLAALRTRVSLHSFLHALYMGPSGCGKSMDLSWLAEAVTENPSLDEPLLIVQFGVGSVVGTHMVGFAELSVALVLELYATFDALRLPALDEGHLDKIEDWFFSKRERTTSTTKSAGVGLGLRLKALRLEFSGAKSQAETVVATYQNRLFELRSLVEELLAEVESITGKHVLFVVDDLEKINPLDAALGLFLNQAGFFAGLPCHMVLTAPGALRLDPRFGPDVLKHFAEFRAVLGDPSSPADSSERDRLVQLVHRRVLPELLATDALELAIEKTGGVVGHLVDVLQRSILHAIAEDDSQVRMNHVEETLKNVQQRWLHSLKDAHYEELVRVREGGADAHLEEPSLLHSLAVLEYPDSPIRFAVHPLVLPLVERWERANENRTR